jgi:hypothetical protein
MAIEPYGQPDAMSDALIDATNVRIQKMLDKADGVPEPAPDPVTVVRENIHDEPCGLQSQQICNAPSGGKMSSAMQDAVIGEYADHNLETTLLCDSSKFAQACEQLATFLTPDVVDTLQKELVKRGERLDVEAVPAALGEVETTTETGTLEERIENLEWSLTQAELAIEDMLKRIDLFNAKASHKL